MSRPRVGIVMGSASDLDIMDGAVSVLKELGIEEEDLHISNKTQDYYNPGRSGSINLKSEFEPRAEVPR